MNIRGPFEFAGFLSANSLQDKESVFIQLVNCVNNFRSACNCYKKEDKDRMYNTCNRLYQESVKHIVPRMKDVFLSKTSERQISFYTENGDLLRIVSR